MLRNSVHFFFSCSAVAWHERVGLVVQAFPSHSAAGSIDLQHHRRRQSGGTAQHSTAQHGTGTTARATDTRIRADSTALDVRASRVCVHYGCTSRGVSVASVLCCFVLYCPGGFILRPNAHSLAETLRKTTNVFDTTFREK